ncbi:hypothetical protein ACFLXL_01210 [Chloroflexota bacterium]
MRHVGNALLALLFGIFSPIVIWVMGGIALYQSGVIIRDRKEKDLSRTKEASLICAIDADCLSGFVCLNGNCVPG